MACNSCAKPFTLLRKEKGCPGCGFSYCSNCLGNKVFLEKLNREAKVCSKCKKSATSDEKKIVIPPDAYYKRIGVIKSEDSDTSNNTPTNNVDEEIRKRLQHLKEDKNKEEKRTTDEEISKRLQNIKGPQPTTSDAELHIRLANLKGLPAMVPQDKPVLKVPDTRTEQEQTDDLMKQYLEQANIDTLYRGGFNKQIKDIEERVQKLRGISTPTESKNSADQEICDFEDEETTIKKIIEKAKAESLLQDAGNIPPTTTEELPFCEICNEDAIMRCLGCRYLFCKQCFLEHKDDDDGCNRYEPFKPPKNL